MKSRRRVCWDPRVPWRWQKSRLRMRVRGERVTFLSQGAQVGSKRPRPFGEQQSVRTGGPVAAPIVHSVVNQSRSCRGRQYSPVRKSEPLYLRTAYIFFVRTLNDVNIGTWPARNVTCRRNKCCPSVHAVVVYCFLERVPDCAVWAGMR